ncbi:hypothetical protein [Neptuniibacter sp. 2_MG-2023]|jgi:hypothetical protein|uniref:hypothetical protein n=1 Tax=Neptuniibacter sp. 2_MG-2023 TaxID=3062671 RepID=UPI0026E3EA72|nr:hypothetical protein [Neptuniibacter sp. 2_MG-2023]MDO6513427.1 hypothetical protein [Neptuniibacter sp. 2_MG-2023]
MLKLIKDFHNYQFVYYWINNQRKKVSPNLPTKQYAEEWLIHYHFETYSGRERRCRMLDRRSESQKINLRGVQIFFSKRKGLTKGRRRSDLNVEVDFDLSKKKLNKLRRA